MNDKRPDIFEFLDASQFLTAHMNWKKSLDPKFSIKKWSEELNFGSKVTLRFILQRKRSISQRTMQVLKSNLRLSDTEGQYFEVLVGYSQAKTAKEKKLFGAELLKFHKTQFKQTTVDPLVSSKHAFIPVLLTLLTFNDFRKDAENISFLLELSKAETENLLHTLVTEGLVIQNVDGTYSAKERTFRIPDNENLRKFYEYWIDRAKAALDLPFEQRRFRALKFALSEKEFSEAIDRINEYALGLLSQFQDDSLADRRLYMFESILFPISRKLEPAVEDKQDITDKGPEL